MKMSFKKNAIGKSLALTALFAALAITVVGATSYQPLHKSTDQPASSDSVQAAAQDQVQSSDSQSAENELNDRETGSSSDMTDLQEMAQADLHEVDVIHEYWQGTATFDDVRQAQLQELQVFQQEQQEMIARAGSS